MINAYVSVLCGNKKIVFELDIVFGCISRLIQLLNPLYNR